MGSEVKRTNKGKITVELNPETKLFEVVSYVPTPLGSDARNFVSEHLCESSANRRALEVGRMLGYDVVSS